jgi:hypothetical protein
MSLHPISGRLYPFEENFYVLSKPLSSHIYQWAVLAVRRSNKWNRNCFNDKNTFLGLTDAFRHAYWSAILAKKFSPQVSLTYTTAHEIEIKNNQAIINIKDAPTRMDMINNLLGTELGARYKDLSAKELEARIMNELRAGRFLYIKDKKLMPTSLSKTCRL